VPTTFPHPSFTLVARISWSHLQQANTSFLPWINAWLPTNFKGNMFILLSYICS
jgi:hypothetical protein